MFGKDKLAKAKLAKTRIAPVSPFVPTATTPRIYATTIKMNKRVSITI
jgi:hypothetical protein